MPSVQELIALVTVQELIFGLMKVGVIARSHMCCGHPMGLTMTGEQIEEYASWRCTFLFIVLVVRLCDIVLFFRVKVNIKEVGEDHPWVGKQQGSPTTCC